MSPRTAAIIQARMGSERLPGKVMMDLNGEPVLARVVNRTSRAMTVDEVVVATTTSELESPLVGLCEARGWLFFRGSEDDVLDRFYSAACEYAADVVIRLTADNPLVDPEIIDRVVTEFIERQPEIDYAATGLGARTYPLGLGLEVMRFDALARAWRLAADEPSREHVTSFIRTHPEMFNLHGVRNESDCSQHRWTVDTTEDLELIRRIYGYFSDDLFSWRQVLELLENHPDWEAINSHVVQRTI